MEIVVLGLKIAMRKCILYSLFFGILALILLCLSANYCASHLLHGKITEFPIYIMAISMPFNSVITSLSRILYWSKKSLKNLYKQNFQHDTTSLFNLYTTIHLPLNRFINSMHLSNACKHYKLYI